MHSIVDLTPAVPRPPHALQPTHQAAEAAPIGQARPETLLNWPTAWGLRVWNQVGHARKAEN